MFVCLLFVLLVMSRQLQVSRLSKRKSLLKIDPGKINAIKINPLNPSLEESSIYKYGELC